MERKRLAGEDLCEPVNKAVALINGMPGFEGLGIADIEIGSVLYANKPGDGSAREQAASCQRVLGGLANITQEYATKRYRSNCINWGMLPFQLKGGAELLEVGDFVFVPNIKDALDASDAALQSIQAHVIDTNGQLKGTIELFIAPLTQAEKDILKAGCLINYNRNRKG